LRARGPGVCGAPGTRSVRSTDSRDSTRTPALAANPCDRPECRQFDFWLGDWNVYDAAGNLQGTNRVESILDRCVVLENWKGTQGPEGKSFNIWTANDSLWHQTWVSGADALLSLSGTFHDGRMVPGGPASSRQPKGLRNRITWTPRPDGSVTQSWETSKDNGATWSEGFLGIYRRKKSDRTP
jgi:hypothetical protein